MIRDQRNETAQRSPEAAAVRDFASALRGRVLRPGEDGYDAARRVWNAAVDKQPALIARCAEVEDVVRAVRFAREHGLLVAVRGGGHNVAGSGTCDGGIVVDLSPMKGIVVDPAKRTARAQAGLTWGEFDRETQRWGLATTGGLVSSTGIGGLTLGGGLGWLMRRHGLTCDNLLSASLVLADGARVTASADEHPDLFWGLRGGGGNFGIVTSFEYRLHPVGPVLAGLIAHPWERARAALRFYRELSSEAPDELTAHALLFKDADGAPALAFVVCCSGSLVEGEEVLRPLREWGPPADDTVAPVTYTAWQTAFDAANPSGLRNYWKSNALRELGDGAIDALIERFPSAPAPRSNVLIERLGGAVGRVGEQDTAYTHRDAPYDFLAAAVWDDPADDEPNIAWAREIASTLAPFARDTAYVNYLGEEGVDRVRAAYGAAKYERLAALKAEYDPTNLFRANQNIEPSPAAVE